MSNIDSSTDRDILVELTETNVLTRWPCHVCGGRTAKVDVLAEVLSGPYKGLRVCERCLKAGDIDTRLARQADELEEWVKERVKKLRALIGRLQVPSYAEWRAYQEQFENPVYTPDEMVDTDGGILDELENITHDHPYAAWRRRAEREYGPRIAYVKNRQAKPDDDMPS
jgi:hypothetical protein